MALVRQSRLSVMPVSSCIKDHLVGGVEGMSGTKPNSPSPRRRGLEEWAAPALPAGTNRRQRLQGFPPPPGGFTGLCTPGRCSARLCEFVPPHRHTARLDAHSLQRTAATSSAPTMALSSASPMANAYGPCKGDRLEWLMTTMTRSRAEVAATPYERDREPDHETGQSRCRFVAFCAYGAFWWASRCSCGSSPPTCLPVSSAGGC